MNGLAICAGVGGIDLGLAEVIDGYRTVCYLEREVYAAAVLVSQMEKGNLAKAPIWDDVGTFDGRRWRGCVDIIHAGLPCQPYSVAGKRRGERDERFIWNDFFRIVDEIQPSTVFLENVPGLISTLTLGHRADIRKHFKDLAAAIEGEGCPRARWYASHHTERLHRRLLREYGISMLLYVGCELEARGYAVAAGLFTAAEVGAPHKRERLFILAHTEDADGWGANGKNQCRRWVTEAGGPNLTFPPGPTDPAWTSILQRWPELAPAVAYSKGKRWTRREQSRQDMERNGLQPSQRKSRVEQQGEGQATQPQFRRVADGLSPGLDAANRVDRLRALGNAVVPLTAAVAFIELAKAIERKGGIK